MDFYQPEVLSDDVVATKLARPGKQIMFLTADWCGDCKAIKPFVQNFKNYIIEQGMDWVDVDRDENIEIAKAQNLRGIPAFVLFENGQQIKHIGDGERLNPKDVQRFLETV
ncbi:thioredoxin family protein [Weissella diestrammenae]|uniref:Thioredoxin family protein n=1 Tax=Weissella diestrammenae TaxID=1162633 RepID=A0A7G9T5D2_9LACO|nr:thioredoxin family protein [Weissella diestrammenae]MCM0583166.1 thioredoxin family protein [Weissella diestrammenae]QNN75307.1 thioredoxin family protein [Weissella diestrammenae]